MSLHVEIASSTEREFLKQLQEKMAEKAKRGVLNYSELPCECY